jgi:hypothetical protein
MYKVPIVGDLKINIMRIVKDDKLILTVYASMSCSLQNSSRLILYTEGYRAQKY